MVELNPQALLAALEANHAHKADPGRKGCGIEKAIRAYLSAIPAPDDGLVERLNLFADHLFPAVLEYGREIALLRDAATALQSKDEQIERLTRESEIADRNRDAARANFLTMQQSAATLLARAEAAEQQVQKLTAENERLREVFKRLGKSDRQLVKDRSALTQKGEGK